MFVYGTSEPLGPVNLEDEGFFLVFSVNHDDPTSPVSLTAYPPGSTPPGFGKKEGIAEVVGCIGVLRLKGLNYLVVVQEPVKSVGLQDSEALERLKQQQQRDDACEPKSRSARTPPTATASPHIHGTPEFIWNIFLLQPLQIFRATLNPTEQALFDARFFILRVIQGYYGAREVQLGEEKVMLSVVSRRGWARAGTRFKKRGIDPEGNVSNFAETETILQTSKSVVSFVQVRGRVPHESYRSRSTDLTLRASLPGSRMERISFSPAP
ncbi:hypothetical protein JCM1841_000732 [Sporobolomyces salmonicolor]